MTGERTKGRRLGRWILGLYAALLATSWTVGALRTAPPLELGEFEHALELPARDDEGGAHGTARVVYRQQGPWDAGDAPVLLLLHGSPGSLSDFRKMNAHLAARNRLLAPDLPGFGRSARDVPSYSVRAHARTCLDLLDALEVDDVHVVGFSMGSGVGLEMVDLAPKRVASLTLLAGIGVEELELFGQHELNHALHGLQLWLLRAARWLVPHFGALDNPFLGVPYARNFYDTDQRRLRPILERMEQPLLVVHGAEDFLVPLAAAEEHARIAPQSELEVLVGKGGHFIPWTAPAEVAGAIEDFVTRVEAGTARTRATAAPERVAAAARAFDAHDAPPFQGPALLTILLLLAAATMVSEDLACIGAGLLVADGRLGFIAASFACFMGIFVGDMLLYLAGRVFGRPALRRAPLKWIADEGAVARAGAWFEKRGVAVIFLSRLTPGLRLPTYVAAGVLRTRFTTFALFFAIAGVVWTPMLVGIAAIAGHSLAERLGGLGGRHLPWLILLALVLFELYRTLPYLFTHRGRRILRGRWLRRRRWEFWPIWLTYFPVALYVCWLALRHRGLSKVTAANPALPDGGFVGESKASILTGLGADAQEVARFELLKVTQPPDDRARAALEFVAAHGLDYPIVMKPDAGQRGSGVRFIGSEGELVRAARSIEGDELLQERIDGVELGVFWVRHPSEDSGRIFAVTEKILPTLTGDGRRTLEDLVLDDDRACALLRVYARENASRIEDVPADGEEVRIVHVGTHARGAIFHDGREHATPELAAVVERISRRYEGFYFGRYDLRAPSLEHFRRGEGVRVIELNGVTSEATNVYDPRMSIFEAYRTLFAQWRIAYEIGAENARRGAPTMGLFAILRRWRDYRRAQAGHRAPNEQAGGAEAESASSLAADR